MSSTPHGERLPPHRIRTNTAEISLDGSVTTMRVIRAVDDLSRKSGPSIGEVAERLGMEHSNTSRAVDQAVEQGLVEKEPSSTDGRRTELKLTRKGHQAIQDLNVRREDVHADLMTGWDGDETRRLAELLEKLLSSYGRVLGRSPQRRRTP